MKRAAPLVAVFLSAFELLNNAHCETQQLAQLGTNEFLSLSSGHDSASLSSPKDTTRLASWILEIRIKEAATSLGIVVTDEDQRALLREAYKDDVKALDTLTKTQEALPKALREALSDPSNEAAIYGKYLKEHMSYGLWKGHLSTATNEGQIAKLDRLPPPTMQSLYRTSKATELFILQQKLRARLAADIQVTGVEIKDEFNRRQMSISLESVEENIRAQLFERKAEYAWQRWQLEQLQLAPVEIMEPTLEGAFREYTAKASESLTTQAFFRHQTHGSTSTNTAPPQLPTTAPASY